MKRALTLILILGLLLCNLSFSYAGQPGQPAQTQQHPDRFYTMTTSAAQRDNGGSYITYEIDGKQLTRSYRNSDGQEGTTTRTLSFTSEYEVQHGSGEWNGMYFKIYYDPAGDEYYFTKDTSYVRMARAMQAMSETYAPEHCLDLGVKNIAISGISYSAISQIGCTSEELSDMLLEIQDEAATITQGCATNYEKAEALSRWMLDNIDYADDLTGYNGYPDSALANPFTTWDTREAVCYGFAQLMELMLQAVDVPCVTVRGSRGGSHVWNMVHIDGKWTTLDPTNLSNWNTAFLPDAEFAATGLYPFFIFCLPNLIDGSNVYATRILRLSSDMMKVTLEPNGGTVRIPAFYVAIYDAGYTDYYYNLETPTRTGCTFEGWYLQPDFSGPSVTTRYQTPHGVGQSQDHTLYAKWRQIYYSLRVNGGVADQQAYPSAPNYSVTYDTAVTVTADPPAPGQRFDHWQVLRGGIQIDDPTAATTTFAMPPEGAELTAVYRPETPDDVRAREAEDLIMAISDPVTLDDEEGIKNARDAYEALTPSQKALIPAAILDILLEAEEAYEELLSEVDGGGTGGTPGSGQPGNGGKPETVGQPGNGGKPETVGQPGSGATPGTGGKQNSIAAPKQGERHTVGKFQYKITKPSTKNNGAVTLLKPTNKKSAKAAIPATVKIKGYTFKVTAISSKAFKNNKRLRSVTIGKNIKTIGASAFSGCIKLKSITIQGTTLKAIGSNAFKKTNKAITIKAPASKLKAYKKLLKNKGLSKKAKLKKK